MAFLKIELSPAFLISRRHINPATNCWEWTGSMLEQGYGRVKVAGKIYKPHRLSAYYFLGLDLKDRQAFVCHLCDNKKCFNPEHLKIADNTWNQRDALAKGLLPNGEKNINAKLCSEDIREIRYLREAGWTYPALAEIYEIGMSQLHRICNGRTWRHI